MEGKRIAISKRVRFDVFKRDSFKCQYCGKSAPDVILEVDHIKLNEGISLSQSTEELGASE